MQHSEEKTNKLRKLSCDSSSYFCQGKGEGVQFDNLHETSLVG